MNRLSGSVNQITDLGFDQIDGNPVFSTMWNDQVSMLACRFNELHVHWTNGFQVLLDDGINIPATAENVPLHTTDQADIQWRITAVRLEIRKKLKEPVPAALR